MSKAKREPKAPKAGSTLLKRVYIWENEDGDLFAFPDVTFADDGDVIGTYDLVEVSRVVIKTALEPVK